MKFFRFVFRNRYTTLEDFIEIFQKPKEGITNKRKIVNMDLWDLKDKEDEMTEIVKEHQNSLKSLTIWYFDINLKFMSLLASAPCLEGLKMTTGFPSNTFDPLTRLYDSVISLKKLKTVEINLYNIDFNFFSFIDARNVEYLRLSGNINADGFRNFLATQTALTDVELYGNSELRIIEMFENDLSGGSYQLRKLDVFDLNKENSVMSKQAENNFLKFLRTRGKSLRKLCLFCTLTPKIVEVILSELKFLKDFTVLVNLIPLDYEFYKAFQPSKSLRELILFTTRNDDQAAKIAELKASLAQVDEWNLIVKKYFLNYKCFVIDTNGERKVGFNSFMIKIKPNQ